MQPIAQPRRLYTLLKFLQWHQATNLSLLSLLGHNLVHRLPKKKIKGVSTELREQCVRGFHMRETTLVQHTALCHCVSQENVIQLKPVYSNPPLSLPPLHPSWSQLSRSSSLSRTIFASPLRVGDGGTQKLSNVVSWS